LRAAAAAALGATSDPRASERLVVAMRTDGFEYVRAAAATALRTHLGESGVRAALEDVARHDADGSVRAAARAANP